MRITRLGHSTLLVETARTRVLIDPGVFSDRWHGLTDLGAVLVTHQHPDHVDVDNLAALIGADPATRLLVEPAVVDMVEPAAEEVRAGDTVTVGDLTVEVVGGDHAVIHPDIPRVGNVGYVVSEGSGPRVFHPGDSYGTTPDGVDVLALPLTAPWANIAATIDFARSVAAPRMFPIHDAIVSEKGRPIYARQAEQMTDSSFDDPPIGEPFDV